MKNSDKKASNKKKVSNESALFMIMLFVIGGFTVIMLGILNSSQLDNSINEDLEPALSDADLEAKARNQVLVSSLFRNHSNSYLFLTEKKTEFFDTN